MNQEILDKIEILAKHQLTDWEKSFAASVKASTYPTLTAKQQYTFDNLWEKYENKDPNGQVPAKKPSNPQWQDPLFLVELAIKKCTGKPEFANLAAWLEKSLRETKASLMKEDPKKESFNPDEIDIPF